MYDYNTNQSLCAFPWTHNYSGPRYTRKLCCTSDDVEGLDKTTEEEYLNSPELKQIRLDMLTGKKIPQCHNCYKVEGMGLESMRRNSFRLGLSEKDNEFDKYVEQTLPDGTTFLKPIYYDNRTIHCNLQCVSCGPTFSSEHINLFKKMHGTLDGKELGHTETRGHTNRTDHSFVVDKEHEEIFSKEFIEGLEEKRIRSIYWAGGEPFMSVVHWKVMDKMLELREEPGYQEYIDGIRIHYNTNMTRATWKGKPIAELLKPYKNLYVEASLDGSHETFEWTRDGANWDKCIANYKSFLDAGVDIKLTCVMSGPVILDFDRYMDFFEQEEFSPRNFVELSFHRLHQNEHAGFEFAVSQFSGLDPCFYPEEIIVPACERAIERLKNSPSVNNENFMLEHYDVIPAEHRDHYNHLKQRKVNNIGILQYYIKHRQENKEIYDDLDNLIQGKTNTIDRDRFHKTTTLFDTLYASNREAYDWYNKLNYILQPGRDIDYVEV